MAAMCPHRPAVLNPHCNCCNSSHCTNTEREGALGIHLSLQAYAHVNLLLSNSYMCMLVCLGDWKGVVNAVI